MPRRRRTWIERWLIQSWRAHRSLRQELRATRSAVERIADALDRWQPTSTQRRPRAIDVGYLTDRDRAAWDLTERSLRALYGRPPTSAEIEARLEEAVQHLEVATALDRRA